MLDIKLNTSHVDTTQPLFADKQTLQFTISKIEKVEAENDKPAKIKFVLALAEPGKDENGNPILPGGMGSTITEFVPLAMKADAKDAEWHLKKLGSIQDAALGTGFNHPTKPARPDFDGECAAQMLGRTVALKLRLDQERTDPKTGVTYRKSNSVGEWIFPGDLKA